MKELNQHEVDMVSGADFKGMLTGFFDGASTGMAIGGKWGGAGGWGFGALAQLVGLIVPTAMGAVAGSAIGLLHDSATVAGLMADFRDKFGPGSVGRTTI
ncbi:hypothetical protein PUP68_20040 [Pseudomonas chlororaphis]|uniref:DUF5862 family protein n=1 Tax=Pseudomonas chlororaphis TaxID=587753 RepID=UPI002368AE2B|nr:hypothetical protein [Pseudomonas chlororaphis]WDG77623.1 hypothetical protein PUP77_24820 [Pseudomonas chlororaphis]WDG83140.1 hypothetical protein PUP68_20040 [Pseudomonas chlororaphis]